MNLAFIVAIFSFSHALLAHAPSTAWIIAEMTKRCTVLSQKSELKGIIKEGMTPALKSYFFKANFNYNNLKIYNKKPITTDKNNNLENSELKPLYFLSEYLSCSSPQKILAYIQKAGINTAVSSTGMKAWDVVYIIGAQPGQMDLPQLWIDKERFFPLFEKSAGLVVNFEHWPAANADQAMIPAKINIDSGSHTEINIVIDNAKKGQP
jgi:hypothetical protein